MPSCLSEQVVSALPEVCVLARSSALPAFLILATDGLWSVCSSAEAARFVSKQVRASPRRAAPLSRLLSLARSLAASLSLPVSLSRSLHASPSLARPWARSLSPTLSLALTRSRSDPRPALSSRAQLEKHDNPQLAADELLEHVLMELTSSDNVYITVALVKPVAAPEAAPARPEFGRQTSAALTPPTNSPLPMATDGEPAGQFGAGSALRRMAPPTVGTFDSSTGFDLDDYVS